MRDDDFPAGRDADELVGMPIIATDSGREIGRVHDILFDPDEQAVLGLMVTPAQGRSTQLRMFLDRDDLLSMGRDAITVVGEDAVRSFATEQRAQDLVDSGIHLKGAQLLSEAGDALGTIDRVLIGGDCRIVAYRATSGILGISKEEVSSNEVLRVGEDAVVVRGMHPPSARE